MTRLTHRRAWWAGGLVGAAVAVGAFWFAFGGERNEPVPSPEQLTSIRAAAAKIKPLHQVKAKPQPGDWLAEHPEAGQTFDQYLKSNPNRPTEKRTTLYLQPLGEFDAEQSRLIEDTEAMMVLFFGVPVKRLPAIGLDIIPDKARRTHPAWKVKQILSTHVLSMLVERRPEDAVAVIALTTSDLWPGAGWNFVFGQASLTERVGVWSLARFGDPKADYPLVLRRTLKTAVHETGHMLGIHHCIAYECGMNGSNNLNESDRTPLWWCPECEQKAWWACRLKPEERYAALAEYARERKLSEPEKFWRDSLELLRAK